MIVVSTILLIVALTVILNKQVENDLQEIKSLFGRYAISVSIVGHKVVTSDKMRHTTEWFKAHFYVIYLWMLVLDRLDSRTRLDNLVRDRFTKKIGRVGS